MTPEHTHKVFWCNWLHSTESELSSRSNETSLLKCVTPSWELLLGQWAWIWGPWWRRNTLLLATTINQGKESVGQHQKASNPSSRFKLLYTDSKFRITKRQSAWIIISFRNFRKCAVILDTWRQLLLDNIPFWNLLNGLEDSLWQYSDFFNYAVTALSTIASAPLLFAVFNSAEEKLS